MKRIIYICVFGVFSCLLIFSACSKEMSQSNSQLTILDFDDSNPAEFPKEKMGPYASYFTLTKGYQNIKFNHVFNANSNNSRFNGYVPSSLHQNTKDKFLINDEDCNYLKTIDRSERLVFSEKLMGKTIEFTYIDAEGENQYSKNIYFPKQLIIDTFQLKYDKPKNMTKRFYQFGNPIYYNQDKSNANGLMVHLIFRGDYHGMTFSELQSNRREFVKIEKFVHVPEDNGRLDLPESIFEGIPHGAYVSLFIRRASSEMFEVKGLTHKISAGNDILMSLILKRQ